MLILHTTSGKIDTNITTLQLRQSLILYVKKVIRTNALITIYILSRSNQSVNIYI